MASVLQSGSKRDEAAVVRHREGAYCLGTWGNVLIIVWRKAPTVAMFEEIRRQTSALAEQHPGGIGVLIVVEAGTDTPSPEARQANVLLERDFQAKIRGNATVLEGSGVRAVAVRAVISTINLMSPATVPHKVLGKVNEAAPWLAERLQAGDLAGLPAAAETVRRAFPT